MSAHSYRVGQLAAAIAFGVVSLLLLLPSGAAQAAGTNTVETCGAVQSEIYGYGAGMMHQTDPMTTSNVRITQFSSQEHCAAIQWDTSMPAATKVIYAKVGEAPLNVDSTAEPHFWYPHGTTQNNSGMGFHTAILTDLEPGERYSYRIVNRSHPSAIPQISGEMFFTMPTVQQRVAVVPPITLTVTTSPSTPKTTTQAPPAPNTPPASGGATESTAKVAVEPTVAPSEPAAVAANEAPDVIAAATAATSALGSGVLGESTFLERMKRAFSFGRTDATRLDLTPGLGLFAKDKYIVPSLFFLLLLYLLQQLLLPALGVQVDRPLVFWMFGVIALAVLAALLGFFYITLVMLAIFLVLLAWYLLQSAGDDSPGDDAPKALGTPENPKTA